MCPPLGLTDRHILGAGLRAGSFLEQTPGPLAGVWEMDAERVLSPRRLRGARGVWALS